MDVNALQRQLRDFAAARDWQPYHSPKNLAMALTVEAAELLELFQWLTPQEARHLTDNAADKERVGDELADVLLYLLQLADHTGVDLEQAVAAKLAKNARKHPARHPAPPPDAAQGFE
ncbi:MAG TPA: nucleotide pyrophosphohydrolase [Alicycliphilus sp.]|jgi:NTP pyrophosphatase (non-canonical NTP hydrolase)|nr:nucleotide pyrophosphohydrolase [Alicycliphilus sp.]